MIKQLIINGKKSYDDFDLYISQRTISQPKKKSIKESVPFSNVVYDFSDINGEIYWEERTLKYVFDFAELSTEEMEKAKTKVLTWLMNVHDTDIYDPYIGDYHFRGSFESDSWSEDFGAGTLTINFSVYPYKISNSDTSIIEEIGDELTGSSPLTINNSASDDLEGLTIYGNSEQETTEGNQLVDFNNGNRTTGLTATFENDVITIVGDGAYQYQNYGITITDIVKNNPSKVLYFDFEKLESLNGLDGTVVQLNVKNTDGTYNYYHLVDIYKTKHTYTIPNDTSTIETAGLHLYTTNSGTANANKVTITKPMFQFGTDKLEYERFTSGVPSPNPDFPSEVKTLDGVTNEFNINLIPSVGFITNNGDGTLTLAKNTNSVGYAYTETSLSTLMPNAKVGETYKLLFKNTFSKGFYNSNIYLSGSNVYLTYGNTFVLTQEMLDSKVVLYGGYNEVSTISDFIITKDINCDSYVPYGSKYLRVDTKSPNLYNFKDKKEQSNGVSVDKDGWITCTYDNSVGSKSKYLNYYTNNLDLKVSTNYIVVAEIKEVIGEGILYPFSQYGGNGGQFLNSANLMFDKLSNGLIRVCNGTTKSSFANVDYGLRSFVEFRAGESGSITFRLSVLEDITITADKFKYSSYGEDYILIDMKKPNLFDKDNVNILNLYIGEIFSYNIAYQSICIEIEPNTTYTLTSLNHYSDGLAVGTSKEYPVKDGVPTNKAYAHKTQNKVTITSGANDKYLLAYIKWGANSLTEDILNGVKIYKGVGSDDYYELCEIGDTKDELFLDKSTNKITQRIIKLILTGNEVNNAGATTWYISGSAIKSLYQNLKLPNLSQNYDFATIKSKALCTHFSQVAPQSLWNGTNTYGFGIDTMVNDDALYFGTNGMTIEEWVAYLKEQYETGTPVIVYYILETPVEINNDPITLPKTFDDGTIITINDELEVDIDVTYNEKKTLIIDNVSSHRVTPTIMVEGDLTIELNNTSYGLSTGTYNNGLYLESGINEVILRGTGKIKFSYVEEVL